MVGASRGRGPAAIRLVLPPEAVGGSQARAPGNEEPQTWTLEYGVYDVLKRPGQLGPVNDGLTRRQSSGANAVSVDIVPVRSPCASGRYKSTPMSCSSQ